MKPYLCYVYRDRRDVPHFEVITGRDDNEAKAVAQALLSDRPHHTFVEIWEERRLLGAYDRQGAEA